MNKHWERNYKKGATRIRLAALWAFIGFAASPEYYKQILAEQKTKTNKP